MSQPFAPSQPPPSSPSASNRALWSLILGILGVLCCGLLAPVAWYLGQEELKSIRAGQGDASKEGLALAGKILGIIGTVLLGFALLWIAFFGGLSVLSTFGSLGG